jgi:RimJ/RimL family protein N-acetyltransferase
VTGGDSELLTALALHALERSGLREPPRPAAGRLRAPAPPERELLLAWGRGFAVDAEATLDPAAATAMVARLIDDGRAWVWDRDGVPVSLVGHTAMVAGVPRIGPVYTPPEDRARGYASSAVYAVGRRLLDAGARRIVLFTDLANPTSNRIYPELGYRRIGDFEEHALRR